MEELKRVFAADLTFPTDADFHQLSVPPASSTQAVDFEPNMLQQNKVFFCITI